MDHTALSPALRASLDEADPRAMADYVGERLQLTEGDWTLEFVFERGHFKRAHATTARSGAASS